MVVLNLLTSGGLALCLTTLALATSNVKQHKSTGFTDANNSANHVGYLGIIFKDDTEQINAILSKGNSAVDFEYLNGGKPILTSNVGRKHTRDPFLVRDSKNKINYIIATDNSLKAINNDFDRGNRFSSRQIVIYKSKGDSLIEWKDAVLSQELMDERSGGVSAPEAIWDEKEGKFLVTFSSNQFEKSDTEKSGKPGLSQIWYSYTTDFVTFTTAKPYFTIKNGGAVDMTIAKITEDCYIRFFRNDTNSDLKVQGQISHNGLYGRWNAISPRQQYIVTDHANGGPLVFQDNLDPGLVHLWIDDFQLAYRAFESGDFKKGFTPSNAPNFLKDMKQGSVTPLTKEEYDSVKTSKWAQN